MTSVVDTSVKHAYSSMVGAPEVSGAAGSLISALDAFLVTGWGAKAVDSATVSNGVCRLNFASGKSSAEFHSVILVSGMSNPALNGEQRVTAVANNWLEFATDEPDGAVTGSISFKMAPLGWEKVFSATNKAVYRQIDPASTRTYYRFDDSNALYARVQMYESMTDIDNGIAVAPGNVVGGYYWNKRTAAGAGVYWAFVGDSRTCYVVLYPSGSTATSNAGNPGPSYTMGDLNSFRSGDAWCAVLTGIEVNNSSWNSCIFCTGNATGFSIKRMSHGIGGVVQGRRRLLGTNTSVSGDDVYLGDFPSMVDFGLFLSPIMISEGYSDASPPRGIFPGAFHCAQKGAINYFGKTISIINGQREFFGKKILTLHIGNHGTPTGGVAFFDISGPWRQS